MAKPPCPICRSKKTWKKQAGTGMLMCSCGYILQGYRNETSDGTDLGMHALKKRSLKSTRATKEKKSRANPILYHGDRARFHYFQCLQLLLRMQVQKLTELWDLPPEFEIICRDTWSLHLSLLASPPPPEPYLHSQEQDISPEGNKGVDSERERTEQISHDSDSDSGSSSTLDDEDNDEIHPEMDKLLQEASEDESSSESSPEPDSPRLKGVSHKRLTRWRRDDSPAGTICVLIHSCWFLRIPVIYQDLVSLVETYTLPYLEPIRLFPPSLTRHLTKHTKQALSPRRAPKPSLLHTITSRLSRLCSERYGIFTPELNTAPILWRAVHHLGGTPSLYALAKALARYLDLPLSLNKVTAPPLFRQEDKDPSFHKSDNVPPEVSLIATVIIALKLIYGLEDGKQVTPRENWDPAHTMPTLEAYMDHLRALDASDFSIRRKTFPMSSINDVQNEDDWSIDAYLGFCERALLGRAECDSRAEMSDLVAEYFPLEASMEADEQGQTESRSNGNDRRNGDNDEAQSVLPAVHAEGRELLPGPGESYTVYNAHDIFGKLPEEYAIVLSRSAGWTGVSEDELSAVMERFERRLDRRWKRRKRLIEVEIESESARTSDL